MQFSRLFSFILIVLVFGFEVCESQDCRTPSKIITVGKSNNKKFSSIQSAIDSVPEGNNQWIHIKIERGVYREQITIPKNKECIYLQGSGRKVTSVEWGDHQNATFGVKANNTVAMDITFVNTLNNPIRIQPGSSPNITQAKAARIHGDKCAFINCGFFGVQDTLYDSYGRHYYYNSYIQGAIDFIYGNGQSLFKKCKIVFSMGKSGVKSDGIIAAHKRESPNDPSGFVFNKCKITGRGGGKAILGRSLRPYGRIIITNSYLSDVVRPEGWSANDYVGKELNITFVEEGNRGPGARLSQRVPWMKHFSTHELDHFLGFSFIDEGKWIPKLPMMFSI